MVRMLFFLIVITLLVVYVPENVRQDLKNSITFVYETVHKFIKQTFPEGSDKLKDLLAQATYTDTQQINPTFEERQINECSERTNREEDSKDTINEQKTSSDHKQLQKFYRINRDKLIELMEILGEPNNDKIE
ncbi:MAG: hypothetical protein AMJ42_00880 [Deltaproteobacteria bacterium DG_8]|nr:MAG: hypothetical protein AMJ42_00880 [Deltaproteobacteria bacterium DG_8]